MKTAYLVVVPEVAYLHVFLHVVVVEILLHPSYVTPVEIPPATVT